MSSSTTRAAAIWLGAALAIAGCGDERGRAAPPAGELLVLAAASLVEAFPGVGAAFEREVPGARVRFSFAGSQTLATQVTEGAPADVIATADPIAMAPLEAAGLVEAPSPFAGNRLTWVFHASVPAESLGSPEIPLEGAFLRQEGWRLALAGPDVPAGRYARQALAELGLLDVARVRVVSHELDVRGVLGKVRLGEADVGLVYASDVAPELRAGVSVRPLPRAVQVRARYLIAVLREARRPELARRFAAFVRSTAGREQLVAHGFEAP
jgi:molybdate transport system substrate-binding protein